MYAQPFSCLQDSPDCHRRNILLDYEVSRLHDSLRATGMGPIRILIADDHDAIRGLLRDIVQSVPEWTVCGEARNGKEAIQAVEELHPDLTVMDAVMPERNGFEATREITKRHPEALIVMNTLHELESFADHAREAGACGCFLKAEAGWQLVTAVHAALEQGPHGPFFTASDLDKSRSH